MEPTSSVLAHRVAPHDVKSPQPILAPVGCLAQCQAQRGAMHDEITSSLVSPHAPRPQPWPPVPYSIAFPLDTLDANDLADETDPIHPTRIKDTEPKNPELGRPDQDMNPVPFKSFPAFPHKVPAF